MNLFYITGTSSGIGEAIAKILLEDPNNMVIGISRSCTIQHDRYQHFFIDLSQEWSETVFKKPLYHTERVVLINNAGSIGPIKPLSQHTEQEIIQNYYINLIAPAILSKQFMNTFGNSTTKGIILNISSGAGKHPIPSWSTYCSSKSGLDMLSKTVDLECSNIKIYAVAPGIVDTAMQDTIREADIKDFPDVDRFIAYKSNGELCSSEEVAHQYVHFLMNDTNYNEVLYSVRDF